MKTEDQEGVDVAELRQAEAALDWNYSLMTPDFVELEIAIFEQTQP